MPCTNNLTAKWRIPRLLQSYGSHLPRSWHAAPPGPHSTGAE